MNETTKFVTILDLAAYRLGADVNRPDGFTGGDLASVGLSIMGGCGGCGESLGAYNAYPTKGGTWSCKRCAPAEQKWTDVAQANTDIFGARPEGTQQCFYCEESQRKGDEGIILVGVRGVGIVWVCGRCDDDLAETDGRR